jgi:hypothetical protein
MFIGAGALAGCESMRTLIGVPFDVAQQVAVETARIPYEAGKAGAQGIFDALSQLGK